MKKPSPKTIVLSLTICLSTLLARNILDGQMAFGLFVAGAYCGLPVVSAAVFLLSGIFFGWNAVLNRAVQLAVILIALLVHKRIKRTVSKWLMVVYILVANVFYCAFNFAQPSQLFDRLVFTAAGVAMSFSGIYALKALFGRGLLYKPSFDELVCISLFATALSYCLASFTFAQFNLLMFVAPFAILFMLTVFGNESGLIAAIIFSLAGLFATSGFAMFAVYVLMTLSALTFNKLNRYAAGLSLIIADVLLAYFFDVYGVFDILTLLPTILSVIAFFVVPAKKLVALSDLCDTHQHYAGKSIVNKLRNSLASKLYRLSDVFFAMKGTFFSMTGKGLSVENARAAIVKEVCENVCFDCKMRNNCWRNNLVAVEQNLLQLADSALQGGQATILDISSSLSVNCDRLGNLLSAINSHAENYKTYISRTAETDNSRLLIGEQLGGVSRIMQQLASECKGRLVFNSTKEKEIVDKLIFHNVLTSEAIFVEQSTGISIILTVNKRDLDSAVICSVVASVLKSKVRIDKVEPCDSDAWMSVYLCEEPRFQLTYGIQSVKKSESKISGDTHSFVKVDNNKFLLAICDGMGSGELAESMSSTAISLVENFYRAGFDSDVILSATNKLLAGFDSEMFTAVDICVVNLANGSCDFVKLGASDGLVRVNGQVKYITGSSLPLGVLDEMKPSVTKSILKTGDYILLASDGFWECFVNTDVVADMLNNTIVTNPQAVADDFVEKALANCKNTPPDDITLIIARLV